MCTRTYGPVKFSCGHFGEYSTVVTCKENCGVIKDAPLGISTRRKQVCPDCAAKKVRVTIFIYKEKVLTPNHSDISQCIAARNSLISQGKKSLETST
jgi:NAD-dependent SIR2 family protein deacetylase